MGRPAKFYIRIHISLSNEQLEEIDRIGGTKGRSAAMRKAADLLIAANKDGHHYSSGKPRKQISQVPDP